MFVICNTVLYICTQYCVSHDPAFFGCPFIWMIDLVTFSFLTSFVGNADSTAYHTFFIHWHPLEATLLSFQAVYSFYVATEYWVISFSVKQLPYTGLILFFRVTLNFSFHFIIAYFQFNFGKTIEQSTISLTMKPFWGHYFAGCWLRSFVGCVMRSAVLIRCIVAQSDGSKITYEYKKNLPYDIVEKDCTVEVSCFVSVNVVWFSLR